MGFSVCWSLSGVSQGRELRVKGFLLSVTFVFLRRVHPSHGGFLLLRAWWVCSSCFVGDSLFHPDVRVGHGL